MRVAIPEFCMVVLIGTSGSGKSTFARRHFLPTQILSSDAFRGMVFDDENSQEATSSAFAALHFMLNERLKNGRLTVIDATNVQKEGRAKLLKIAGDQHALKVAIVLNVPASVCLERNQARPDRQFGPHVIRNQQSDLRRTLGQLGKEGFHKTFVLNPDQIEAAEIIPERIWSRRPEDTGPFDIIGDVHGCLDELQSLLVELGWAETGEGWQHPAGRKMFFVGDLVDRGPDPIGVLRLVMEAHAQGVAECVPGNHDMKFLKALQGKRVTRSHGLAETMEAVEREPAEWRGQLMRWLDGLVSHQVLDGGNLVIAHAGMPAEMQGRGSAAVRQFALYGETTGEIDEFGLPVRYPWAKEYRGKATVVYGHTPIPEPEWLNHTINIDTGCCFGGKLTALRWPEKEVVSVPALREYAVPSRPFLDVLDAKTGQQEADTLLEVTDVLGRLGIETRLNGRMNIREENAIAALEIMSRFAADPRWLVYLPPTMSPCATSERPGFLEYPTEAFGYYASAGLDRVICEEKHMGSRAVAVVCRDSDVARRRFGVETGESGVIVTRTGRKFFADDPATEAELVRRLSLSLDRSGVYEELNSDWALLDMELMPWSSKAVGLLRSQYAPVGQAAMRNSSLWHEVAAAAAARGVGDLGDLDAVALSRLDSATKFREAYRRYCWPVRSLEDYKLAPFHLLASEGRVHVDRDHLWHMETLGRVCDADPSVLLRTPYHVVDLGDESAVEQACQWWEDRVLSGGEGMVVKPMSFIAYEGEKVLQPAVKVRGPEYLRIIYGPEYLQPANLERLRKRGLQRKRGLALREFALGVEAMERFVRHEPLRRVHECVFGVLALESEPVDPAL